jgi:hypothetical protein
MAKKNIIKILIPLIPPLSWNHSPLSLVLVHLASSSVFLLMYIEVLHFLVTLAHFQLYYLTILMSHLHNTFQFIVIKIGVLHGSKTQELDEYSATTQETLEHCQ